MRLTVSTASILFRLPALVFLVSSVSVGQEQVRKDEDLQRLDTFVRKAHISSGLPSIAVGIVNAEGLVYARAFGMADVGRGVPATTSTQYRIASLSKVFTTTLLVQLRDEGVVKLDDPVARFLPADVRLPSDPRGAPSISLRHLAQHTSGLPERPVNVVQGEESYFWADYGVDELYDGLSRTSLYAPVGSEVLYSNLGMGLLGHALSRAAGTTYADLLKKKLLDPLKMSNTGVIRAGDLAAPVARGYGPGPERRPARPWDLGCLLACGSIVSNVEDMGRFLVLQLQVGRAGSTPVSGASLYELQRPQRVLDGWRAGIGLGWVIDVTSDLGEVVRHNGSMAGFTSHMSLSPRNRVGVVVLSNGGIDVSGVKKLGGELLRRAVETFGMVAWPTEDRLRMLPSLFRKDPGEELLNLFDPDFIKMFTPGVVKDAFADEAQKRGPCLRIVSIERLQGPWHGRAVLEFKDKSRLQCDVMVAEVYPHRFTYVRLD